METYVFEAGCVLAGCVFRKRSRHSQASYLSSVQNAIMHK